MDNQDFLVNFQSIFDDTDPSDVSLETNFRDLMEWSSMTALSLIAMIDEKYHVKITGDEIRSATTVEDLFKITAAKTM